MVGNSKRKRAPLKVPSPQPSKSSSDPYPDFALPTPEQCRAARDALLAHHGFPEEFSRYRKGTASTGTPVVAGDGVLGETVLDGLVITLLSQNTTDSNSRRAFESLKSAFPTWDMVLDAESNLIEAAIRCGGLARTKAARIKTILRTLKDKRGEICLEYLRKLPIDKVKAELSEFKGIGPKTVTFSLFHCAGGMCFDVSSAARRLSS